MTTTPPLTLDEQIQQRITRRRTWDQAVSRALALRGRTDRQSILDVLHDDAAQLDVGRWFATLPACSQVDGCTVHSTLDPWDKPPKHGRGCVRGQAIDARYGGRR